MKQKASLFSWFTEPMEEPTKIIEWLKHHQVDRLYQFATPTHSEEQLLQLLKTAAEQNLTLYFLNGEPEWALDPTGSEMIQYVHWTQQFQSYVKGIVFDIEPYNLKEFKKNPSQVMTSFIEAMRKVYEIAQTFQLEIILCVPYYYEQLGFKDELEELVKNACDGTAVMNYYRGKEIKHIQTEVALCQKYHKIVEQIYELQPPGMFDLTDQNTYYHAGLEAAYANFSAMTKAYPNQTIQLSFHEYRYFKKLTQKTKEGRRFL